MILSHKLENYQASLIAKLYYIEKNKYNNNYITYMLNIIYALPLSLKIARNISLYKNFIVLCKSRKMHFFYFQFNEITKKITFEKSLHIIKQYVII